MQAGESHAPAPTQGTILAAIHALTAEHKYAPPLREIADRAGMTSPSAVSRQIDRLVELGYIERQPGTTRSIRLAQNGTPVGQGGQFDLRRAGPTRSQVPRCYQPQAENRVAKVNHDVSDPPTVAAAVRDAHRAAAEFDDACNWLEARRTSMPPLCAEAWVFDRECRHVLLVQHRWRGWVPPGGKVEPGEAPREAAERELWEETGVKVRLGLAPAAVCVRSYRADWSATLGLSYSAITDADSPLTGEVGQPAAWIPLHEEWRSVFPEDWDRIRCHAQHLARSQGAAAP